MNGKQLERLTRETFSLSPNDDITTKQLNYSMAMLKPSNYMLQHHTVKGNPITFSIPDYNTNRAFGHRPLTARGY